MREMIISKTWAQVAILVFAFGFFVLGFLAYRTYVAEPPVPENVTDPSGATLFTGADIIGGQEAFLRNGLMEFGSIYGHGAYLGPDFTADYLHRAALIELGTLGGPESDRARAVTAADFKQNRYNPATGTLLYSEPQARAYRELLPYYRDLFSDPTTRLGLRSRAVTDTNDLRRLTAYFSWTAWTAAALRPGFDYTYTNNWPPEPLVNNRPSAEAFIWSVISLITLLGGIGLMLASFGRWEFLGWHGRDQQELSFVEPGSVPLTPGQRASACYFFVMVVLFLAQALLGGSIQHYRAEISNFFGFDLARCFPSISPAPGTCNWRFSGSPPPFWPPGSSSRPMIAGREPHGRTGSRIGLLAALAVVVVRQPGRRVSPAFTAASGAAGPGSATRGSSTWIWDASGRSC